MDGVRIRENVAAAPDGVHHYPKIITDQSQSTYIHLDALITYLPFHSR